MMSSPTYSPGFTIAELVFQVCRSGRITQTHRQQLRHVILQETLTEEDYSAIDRLFYAIRRGWLQLVD